MVIGRDLLLAGLRETAVAGQELGYSAAGHHEQAPFFPDTYILFHPGGPDSDVGHQLGAETFLVGFIEIAGTILVWGKIAGGEVIPLDIGSKAHLARGRAPFPTTIPPIPRHSFRKVGKGGGGGGGVSSQAVVGLSPAIPADLALKMMPPFRYFYYSQYEHPSAHR